MSYRPQVDTASAPTANESAYLYREIIDLRDSNEVTLTFPYMTNTQWKNVYRQVGDPIYQSAYGQFFVSVINPLVAPTGAPTSVRVIMEVSAADDYELAFPRPFGRGTQYSVPGFAPRPFYTQMDDGIKAVSKDIGSSHRSGGDLASSLYCHGETVMSIKQLLLRYCVANTSVLTGTSAIWDINPFAIGAGATSVTGLKTPDLATDYYALLCSCFAVARGSVRIAVQQTSGNDQRITAFYYYPSNPTDNEPTRNGSLGGSTINSCGLVTVHNMMQCNNLAEYRLPAYNSVPTRLNKIQFDESGTPPVTYDYDPYVPRQRLRLDFTVTTGTRVLFRAVGDDFQLGYFLGVPPILTHTS